MRAERVYETNETHSSKELKDKPIKLEKKNQVKESKESRETRNTDSSSSEADRNLKKNNEPETKSHKSDKQDSQQSEQLSRVKSPQTEPVDNLARIISSAKKARTYTPNNGHVFKFQLPYHTKNLDIECLGLFILLCPQRLVKVTGKRVAWGPENNNSQD